MKIKNPDSLQKKTGITGVVAGVLALVVCELPIALAFLGMGGLSTRAISLRPPAWLEVVAIIFALLGGGMLIRRYFKQRVQRN